MKRTLLLFSLSCCLFACKNEGRDASAITVEDTTLEDSAVTPDTATINIQPVSHATAVINFGETTIYLDPVGGAAAFEGMERPDLVLITDIHGDHLDAETLAALDLGDTPIIAPQAVKEQLPDSLTQNLMVLNNGETLGGDQNEATSGENIDLDLEIEAIPMYNLREEAKQFHPKGRGNGYVLEKDGQRLYIAGDTEDIPEMRNLEDVDIALVPMNLPYTMPVDKAAEAVIEFAPDQVYPYHFRGQDGKADVQKFKQLVNEGNQNVEVILANWYPEEAGE